MPRARALLAPALAVLVLAGCGGGEGHSSTGAPDSTNADSGRGRVADASGAAERFSRVEFRPYSIVDKTQGGLLVGTIAVPEGWNAVSNVEWTYSNVSFPVRLSMRATAPDGSAWVECFPSEMFYWLQPGDTSVPVGGRTLGMIHRPGIGAQEAMKRFILARYRGGARNLQILGFRPIPNLAQALGKPPMAGDSVAARVRYVAGGRTVDEEFFGLLGEAARIPYHGPQGTTYEIHRVLTYVHSMGATDGKLDSLHPLLGFVASSFRPDPIWEQHSQQIYRQLAAQFNQYIAQGYARIAAAGALSRAISANNDAMIQSLEAQRQASSRSQERMSDSFSQYIRGTERMQDPYWGTSEQSYTNKYHWTDGFGNYQHSNDPGFDPNIGSNTSWQRMEPARP